MKLKTLVRLIGAGGLGLFRESRGMRQFYRLSFVATAFGEGVYAPNGAAPRFDYALRTIRSRQGRLSGNPRTNSIVRGVS